MSVKLFIIAISIIATQLVHAQEFGLSLDSSEREVANIGFERPGQVDFVPICQINNNREQVASVRNFVAQISQATNCNRIAEASELSMKLAEFLRGNTALGFCYDDAFCKSANSNSLVEKGTCSAANGKSWMQQTPTQGLCIKL